MPQPIRRLVLHVLGGLGMALAVVAATAAASVGSHQPVYSPLLTHDAGPADAGAAASLPHTTAVYATAYSQTSLDPALAYLFPAGGFDSGVWLIKQIYNNGGVSANSLWGSSRVALDAPRNLRVVDYNNNRVVESTSPLPLLRLYLPMVAKAPLPLGDLTLAFVSNRDGHDEIYSMRGDGSQQTRLTFDAANDLDPVWSPDGSRIAFASDKDGNFEVYVMHADGTGSLRLTQTITDVVHPTWSPDGSRIAFTASLPAGGDDIYSIKANGTGLTRLTDHTVDGLWHDAPAWSRDGKRIAFVSGGDLYVMLADGSTLPQLIYTPTGYSAVMGQPAWSPDSKQIVFALNLGRYAHDLPDLYIIAADGSETQPRDLGENDLPDWSRDGARLAFTQAAAYWVGETAQIGVMNVDGTQQIILTTPDQGDNFEPNWAP